MGVATLPEDTTPSRWEILFFVLGGVTCPWAGVIWIFLPDSPPNARFLNERQRLVAVKRVSENETGIKSKKFNKQQAWVALYDPKMILVWVAVFAAAIPNGVVNSFSTIIIKDLGFSTTKTTELNSVGNAGSAFESLAQSNGLTMANSGYMFFENRRRDRNYGPADRKRSDEAGMQDQTEFENRDFRYVL